MRRYVAVFLCAVAILFAGFCSAEDCYGHYIPKERADKPAEPRMKNAEDLHIPTWAELCVIYDTHTGVMYLITRSGGVCPLIDAEGKPLRYMEAAE